MPRPLTVLLPGCLLAPLAFAAFAVRGGAPEGEAVTVFRGARIHTADGPPIDNGVLVVSGGKITAVGRAGDLPVPDGASVRDVSGKVIIPGLVDTHSHIGIMGRP